MKPFYTLFGVVQHGNKRGKELGFPTANFRTEQKIAEGIYISKILVQDSWHNALTFIGEAKTFDEKEYLAETYILDFDKDIYDEHVTVSLLKKLRNNIKFATSADLVEQMKKDEEEARKFFLSNSHNISL